MYCRLGPQWGPVETVATYELYVGSPKTSRNTKRQKLHTNCTFIIIYHFHVLKETYS